MHFATEGAEGAEDTEWDNEVASDGADFTDYGTRADFRAASYGKGKFILYLIMK